MNSQKPPSLSSTFEKLRREKRMAFIPFLPAGDPDMPTTQSLIAELANRGADVIEVGIPYSDPIADGPVIQASYSRALDKGIHVADIFAGIASLADRTLPPLVAMVSYAIVFRHGLEQFAAEARQAGFSGLIVPDLPGDESEELAAVAADQEIDLVQLVSPTTPARRIDRILQAASGFVYCISATGITGVRNELPAKLSVQLKELRSKTKLPLAVGFGISRPEQAARLHGLADGVIVGSALVRHLEKLANGEADLDATLAALGDFTEKMVAATKR